MHEWHTVNSKNPMNLIENFLGFTFNTDYDGAQKVSNVKVTERVFSSEEDAANFVTRSSYGGNTAYIAAYTAKTLSKGYQNAFSNFISKYKDFTNFKNNLTVGYGRSASKTTCPTCGSSISIKYGGKYKSCPVCGSRKIISDSNWKMLEAKQRMTQKAAENLKKEAEKNSVTFVCGIEWHC